MRITKKDPYGFALFFFLSFLSCFVYLRSFLKKNHEVCNLVSFASLMEIPLVEEGDCFFVSFKYGILDEFVFCMH